MKQYRFQTGTNEKIFDVLTIEDDGRMSLEWHGTDRVLRYEGVELRECEFGTRLYYGKGSSLPWTDAKGKMWKQWEPLTATAAATFATPERTEAQAASEQQPRPQRRRKAQTATETPATATTSARPTIVPPATDESDSEPEIAADQPSEAWHEVKAVLIELAVTTVCTLIFWFSLCGGSIIGAAIAIGMLAFASREGLTPIMTDAALE